MTNFAFYFPLKRALREARNQTGATQEEMAKRARITVPTLRNLENGEGRNRSLNAYLLALNLEIHGDRLPRKGKLGERIAALRDARGLSQRGMAEIIGVSQMPILNIEKGDRGLVRIMEAVLETLDAGAFLAPVGFNDQDPSLNTPQRRSGASVMDPLHDVFGPFDLSPCPGDISGRDLPIRALKHYAAKDDPLRLPWQGKIFLNPPFNEDLTAWVEKAYTEHVNGTAPLVVAYLPVLTNRPWWYQFIADKALVVCLRGVVTFEDTEINELPESLVIWGADKEIQDQIEEAFTESWVIRPKA